MTQAGDAATPDPTQYLRITPLDTALTLAELTLHQPTLRSKARQGEFGNCRGET